jgi:outer membrane receptor protein involved in Fe transport
MTNRTRALLATVLVCGLARHAAAQNRPPPDLAAASIEDLMKILVTTASRAPEGIAAAPARMHVVTAAQIERRGYRSISDLLEDLADFQVNLAGDQDYPVELAVQGTTGASRVVLLLDGIRVSSPTNEPLPMMANYPVHSARQVEIVYGPASALYGADAFSAVINIISKDVAESPGLMVGSSIGQFGLYNQTVSYGAKLGANATLMLSGQFLSDRQPDLSHFYPESFGDLEAQRSGLFNTIFGPMTSDRPVSPAYDVPLSAHSMQARFRVGGLDLSLFENGSRISTSPAYTPDNAVYNDGAFNQNHLFVASGTYTRPIGRVTSASTLTYSRHELDPESGYWNVFSNMRKSFKYAYGSMAKAEQQLSWKPTTSLTMTTGGTFERFFAIPQGADLNAPVQSQDVPGSILDTTIVDEFVKLRYSNVGWYAQARYAPRPRVTLTLGARADYNSRYGGTFNPRLGVVVQPTNSTTLKLLYGTAFLAPSPFQANAHYGSFYSTDGGQTYASSYWHLPNPDLEPQRKRTIEVNALQTVGNDFHFSASLFYSYFSNLIRASDAGQSYAGFYHGWPVDYIDFPVNAGHSYTYGGSLGLDYLRTFGPTRRFEAHAAVALVEGREWQNDQIDLSTPTGSMAPVQLRFGADIDWDRWRIAPRLSIVGTQRLVATIEGEGSDRYTLPSYTTVDVNIRRNLFKTLDAFVTIENALDRRYRTFNSRAYSNPEELIGAPQNPRRVSVGFSLRVR